MRVLLKFISLVALILFNLTSAFSSNFEEFATGSYKKFSTLGHPKSHGINMVISYPNTWLAQEGERSHVVQKIFSEGGRGLEGILITVKKLTPPLGITVTENDIKELFTTASLKTLIPAGAKFIDAKSTTLKDMPAGIVEYSYFSEREGKRFDSQAIMYNFVRSNTLVQLHFIVSTGTSSSSEILARKMDKFRPIFSLVTSNIYFAD